MACLAGCRLQYPAAAVIHTGVQLSVSDRFWHAPIRGKGGTGSGGRLGQGPPTCRTRRTHVVGNRLASGLPPTQQKDVRHGLKLLTLKPGCVCRTCTAQWEGSVFLHGAVPAAWQLRNDSSFHSCKTFAAKSVKVRAEPNTGPTRSATDRKFAHKDTSSGGKRPVSAQRFLILFSISTQI